VEGGVPVRIDDPELRDFVEERLEGLLDVAVEFVRAARGSGRDGLGEIAELARFLASLPQEHLAPVHELYTRSARIIGEKADAEPFDTDLVREAAEAEVAAYVAESPDGAGNEELLAWASALAPVVARFFDDVLVMDPDEALRANRLRLLRDVRDAVGRLGDLSQIPL
jgi:glycyl-tRNA synthetase beta subunit